MTVFRNWATFAFVIATSVALARLHYLIITDLLLQIVMAEYNLVANRKRNASCRRKSFQKTPHSTSHTIIPSIACIIGYRENPSIFEQCLQSYHSAIGCAHLVVGIDGNQDADLDMVRVFQTVRLTS
jgi:hyaluronan synthase